MNYRSCKILWNMPLAYLSELAITFKDNLHRKMIAQSENTQHRGKDHYTAGLQFNKVGFDRKGKYVVIIM